VAYYHHDHLDTPIQATDKNGNIVWAANYNIFGQATITTPAATADSPAITTNLRLPGQYFDDETGLHYNFRRYYDPQTGRYITQDPIGLAGGDNQYRYGEADPANVSDPTGEIAPAIILIGTAARAYGACLARCAAQEVVLDALMGGCVDVGNSAKNCALSCLNPLNWGGKGTAKLGVKAEKLANNITKRPSSFRKKTVQDAWDNAASGTKPKTRSCPTCGKDVEIPPGQGRRDWDVDHQPKWKDRVLTEMSRKQVLDEYNKDVQLRCPSCNRSDN